MSRALVTGGAALVGSHVAAARIHRVSGGRLEAPLANGLAAMAGWSCAWGARAGTPFQGLEVAPRLPESWRRG